MKFLKKKKKEKTIPKNVKKAFAVATYIATALREPKDYNNNAELLRLGVQAKRAMQVFFTQAGPKIYWDLSNQCGNIWEKCGEDNKKGIAIERLPVFIECLSMIIPPKDFKDFLGVNPYIKNKHMYFKDYKNIAFNVLEMNDGLNELLETKSYVLFKPKVKEVKIKEKRERDKKKKKIIITEKKNRVVKKIIEKKERKQLCLSKIAKIAELAKKNNSFQEK